MDALIIGLLLIAIFAGYVALRSLRGALNSYAAEKGRNLAQKEDIEALTRLVEDVKQQNAVLLEDHKARNQLRMAALDRRLQAHQEAYTHWRQLQQLITHHDPDLPTKVDRCFEWWDTNCLYLEPAARKAFIQAAQKALDMYDYRGNPPSRNEARQDWAEFVAGGQSLIASVALPSLAEDNPPLPSVKA